MSNSTIAKSVSHFLLGNNSKTCRSRRHKPSPYIFGSLLQRVIYHYWYYTGKSMAIWQMLGYVDLPEFVGDIDGEASFRLLASQAHHPRPVRAQNISIISKR